MVRPKQYVAAVPTVKTSVNSQFDTRIYFFFFIYHSTYIQDVSIQMFTNFDTTENGIALLRKIIFIRKYELWL